MSKHEFQTEVNQLLHLIIHSLYSHHEIFLRELISNASDAIDKFKYLTLTDEKFKTQDWQARIDIFLDKDNPNTLCIADNGIGMNKDDLIQNLGTIAQSGTKNFLSQMTGDAKKDSNLIGQFGVGFYSCFMVADKVEVISKKAGEDKAYKWTSDGKSGYEIEEAERESQGTTITLSLTDDGKEYASRWQIQEITKKYSNHIAYPIILHYTDTETEGEGDDKKEKEVQKQDQVNSASALWRKNKNDISDDEYKEFYKSVSHDFEDPLFWIHTKAEGTQEYTTLFYIPKKAPFDLYYSDYRPGVKLYVKRVFITDDDKELLPSYLRFVRGVIDSEDLPLNVSREILQKNRVLASIKSNSVKKILGELESMAKNNPEQYKEFIKEFNRPLKEGLYQDFSNREKLMELVRYKSTHADGYTSLAEYKERMKDDQKAIYYISGGKEEVLRSSPLLEAYRKKDIEVLIMDDEIDEIVMPSLNQYKETDLKAVNRSGAADDLKDEEDKQKEKDIEPLTKKIKDVLGDRVKEVKASSRLSDSPSCIVSDDNDPSMQMQQMMKAMGQSNLPEIKPILEINPDHPIVKSLEKQENEALLEDISFLLLEQAMLIEGAPLKNPADFVKRLNKVTEKAL